MEWFVAVVIIAALGVAAIAAAGGLGGMTKEPVRDVYRQDLPDDRMLAAAELNALRFGTALRGYAMDQVDDVLDRLAREIEERDQLIAQLRASQPAPDPTARPAAPPVEGDGAELDWSQSESTEKQSESTEESSESTEESSRERSDEVAPDYR